MELKIVVTDVQYAGLVAVAKKDGITVAELAQKQMDYYLNCVIKSYVSASEALTPEQSAELSSVLAQAKSEFLTALKVEKDASIL